MKRIVLFLFLSFSNVTFGQMTKVEFDVLSSGQNSNCELLINDSISIWNYPQNTSLSIQDPPFLIKNKINNVVYIREGLFNQVFYIKDSLHSMKWEVLNDQKSILDKKCYAAKTNFRGRSYTAYYSADFPISNGPWKFGGLPGLILEIQSDDGLFQYKATKITQNFKGKPETVNLEKFRFISWNEYEEKFISTINKYVKMVKSNGSIDNTTNAKLKIDAPEIIYPKAQTGEGITIE